MVRHLTKRLQGKVTFEVNLIAIRHVLKFSIPQLGIAVFKSLAVAISEERR